MRKSPAKILKFLAFLTAVYVLTVLSAFGQDLSTSADLPKAQIDRIINTFTTKETQFRRALNEYSFKRDAEELDAKRPD